MLKVNVLVARGERLHVDTLDLYAAKARASYVAQAAIELRVLEEIVKADLGRVLLKLEALAGRGDPQGARTPSRWR